MLFYLSFTSDSCLTLTAECDGGSEKALDVDVLFVASTWDYGEDCSELRQFEVCEIFRNLSETGLSSILTACNVLSSLIFSEIIWRITSLLRGSLDKSRPAVSMTNSESSVIRRLCSPFSKQPSLVYGQSG